MKSTPISILMTALAICGTVVMPARAAEGDRAFFKSAEGNWTGPGEIIAGKYKGTKFNCSFAGTTPAGNLGMTMDGDCRVGVFAQKMRASFVRKGGAYRGTFMDGAEGNGLDIVAGNVVDSSKVVLSINRKQLNGIMQARIADENTMNVTVSVRVAETMVQVIGMSLKRIDTATVGSVAE